MTALPTQCGVVRADIATTVVAWKASTVVSCSPCPRSKSGPRVGKENVCVVWE